MQNLSKKDQQNIADKIFKSNEEFKTLFVCEDGNAFSNEASAKSHCSREKIAYNEFSAKKTVVKQAPDANTGKEDTEKKASKAGEKNEGESDVEMTAEEAEAKLEATTAEDLETKTIPELMQFVNALSIELKGKNKTAVLEVLIAKKTELTNSNPE